jgi:CBS domain-containing protein
MLIHADDVATTSVKSITPFTTIRGASGLMNKFDIGFLPVVSESRVVGVLTDRDIALKGIQDGMPDATVDKIMSRHPVCVNETSSLEEISHTMTEHGVRRVLVLNDEGELVGVVSLDDLAIFTMGDQTVGQVLKALALPHTQSKARFF